MSIALPIAVVGAASGLAEPAARLSAEAIGPRDLRSVRTLRLSVTDHCNLRCIYCMPEEGLEWLPRDELLTYEEIVHVARAALHHGIRDFKITGGEPLVRRDLVELIARLRALPGCGELSLTTNGLLLARLAPELRRAGLDRVTVSLDTLRPRRFRELTRGGELSAVLEGTAAADECGLGPAKINVVVLRDYNLDEVADIAAWTLREPRTVRFIEFMPLARSRVLGEGGQFVPYAEIRERIEQRLGPLTPAPADAGSGPAQVFGAPGARGRIGFIHAMSAPFCATCNRLRLTPEGRLRSCLFDAGEVDVRALLRPEVRPERLRRAFVECVVMKPELHGPVGDRQMSSIGG
ncbi:MAG TPA: GTP 3',8-cyclase MoaA [Phycisphaerae bacterium]|nr:GTP 3',8-cyclase MoaA [Phycisphaerae bacterium]